MPVLLVLFALPPVVIALDFLTGHKLIPGEHILAVFLVKYGVLFALVILGALSLKSCTILSCAQPSMSIELSSIMFCVRMGCDWSSCTPIIISPNWAPVAGTSAYAGRVRRTPQRTPRAALFIHPSV
jgi:hypothetical protein